MPEDLKLSAGSRWKSAVCDTEVIVVRPAKEPVQLKCGGHAMLPSDAARPESVVIAPEWGQGTAMGKRYAAEVLGLEILCVKGGKGALAIGEQPLVLRQPNRLPSSD